MIHCGQLKPGGEEGKGHELIVISLQFCRRVGAPGAPTIGTNVGGEGATSFLEDLFVGSV